jgi:hypothetical protein
MNINTEIGEWPISKYIGPFPKGEWKFVKNYQEIYKHKFNS